MIKESQQLSRRIKGNELIVFVRFGLEVLALRGKLID